MLVKDIMTQNIITIEKNESISHAAELMSRYDIGILPVMEDERLIGVITDRDIVIRAVAKKLNTDTLPVSECMSKSMVCANPGQQLSSVAKTMATQQVRRVPVTENGKLCGMLSLADISRGVSNVEIASALCEISRP